VLGSRIHRHHLGSPQVEPLEDLPRRLLAQLVGYRRVPPQLRVDSRKAAFVTVKPVEWEARFAPAACFALRREAMHEIGHNRHRAGEEEQ
jgi:hypothetical protein